MTRRPALILGMLLTSLPAAALAQTAPLVRSASAAESLDPMPMGLRAARLLPGWTNDDGNRVSALELVLEPGWKTYWRSPGDSGLPPSFDWSGSGNLAAITLHWPAPEAISSGGTPELGYHEHLVLPLTAHPQDPGQPVEIAASIELGLCENICVPAQLDLAAPPAGTRPDSRIEAALSDEPRLITAQPDCRIEEIADGMRVEMALSDPAPELAAIEVDGKPDLWISGAEISRGPQGPVAVAEMVGPEAAPFPLDPASLRLTVIGQHGAVETQGCRPRP